MTLLWGLLSGMAVIGGLIGVVAGAVGTTAPRRAPLRQRWQALRAGKDQGEDVRLRRRTLAVLAVVVFVAVWLVLGEVRAAACCWARPWSACPG